MFKSLHLIYSQAYIAIYKYKAKLLSGQCSGCLGTLQYFSTAGRSTAELPSPTAASLQYLSITASRR